MPQNKTDFCCGIVPIHTPGSGHLRYSADTRFLLIKHNAGHWGFPKGHPENRHPRVRRRNRPAV